MAAELDALRPDRILALTGRWWIEPFLQQLGVTVDWRELLAEGIGRRRRAAVVIARQPMGKPGDRFVAEVLHAFASDGKTHGAGIVRCLSAIESTIYLVSSNKQCVGRGILPEPDRMDPYRNTLAHRPAVVEG